MSNQTIGEKNKELWLELDRRATEIADLERQLADVRRRSADYIDALRSQWETGVRSIEEALSIPDDERGFDFGTINRAIAALNAQLAEAQHERDIRRHGMTALRARVETLEAALREARKHLAETAPLKLYHEIDTALSGKE